jgi:hypothetical protein
VWQITIHKVDIAPRNANPILAKAGTGGTLFDYVFSSAFVK